MRRTGSRLFLRSRRVRARRDGLFVARRRHRAWRALPVAAILALGAWGAGSAMPVSGIEGLPGLGAGSGAEQRSEDAGRGWTPDAGAADDADEEAAPPATARLARIEGVELRAPAPRPVLVGFHEASSTRARPLTPLGEVTANENTTRFTPPSPVDGAEDYLVLSSRGRRPGPTSAVDIVLRTGEAVRAPVSGTVTEVRTYQLYGAHEDVRVEIAPHADTDLRVVLIHLEGPTVEVGDDVSAGRTRLATRARPLPFGSQIDRYTEPDRWPHVHLEVKEADPDGPQGRRGEGGEARR